MPLEQRQLILNASALPNALIATLEPTEGYLAILNAEKDHILHEFNNLLRATLVHRQVTHYDSITDQSLAMLVRIAKFIPFNPTDVVLSVFLTAPYYKICRHTQHNAVNPEEWAYLQNNNNNIDLNQV